MELRSRVRKFGQRLRRDFAREIGSNAKGFKKCAVHFLKMSLPPFPGHPREPAITKAFELRKQDRGWKEIYPQVIPHHSNLD